MNINKTIIKICKKHKIIYQHENVVECSHLFAMYSTIKKVSKELKTEEELEKAFMLVYNQYYQWYNKNVTNKLNGE